MNNSYFYIVHYPNGNSYAVCVKAESLTEANKIMANGGYTYYEFSHWGY